MEIQNENQTLASITFQNYFRLYEKLAGMTGTADTEAFEFSSIYKLDTVVVPTNRPMIRKDMADLVYMTEAEKIQAIIEDIKTRTAAGQPVLVGTISIEKSEVVSRELTKAGIKHNVLNAKFHASEADIVAQAGYPSAVTIATNMAGRGTDIMLGGSWQAEVAALENPTPEQIEKIKADWQVRHDAVLAAGGLHIIGTERHESRRIDNQLRGRAGRQGDAGSSRFYLSMEDALMRIFASDRVSGMMRKLGMNQVRRLSTRGSPRRSPTPSVKWKAVTSISVSSCWNMMMWPTTSAGRSTPSVTSCWTCLTSAKPSTASAKTSLRRRSMPIFRRSRWRRCGISKVCRSV